MTDFICAVPNCDRPIARRDWCDTHYRRWLKCGDPGDATIRIKTPSILTEAQAFAWHMPGDPPTGGCWDWTGAVKTEGYGIFWRSHVLAHVVSHRIYNFDDPITEEKPFVLHRCDRPICVHPAHLRAGTHDENMRDMVIRGRHLTKLTEADVLWIKASNLTQRALSEMFGVHRVTISKILLGKTWKHV